MQVQQHFDAAPSGPWIDLNFPRIRTIALRAATNQKAS